MLREQSLRVAPQSVEHLALTTFFGTPLQDFLPSLSFFKKTSFLREPKEGGVCVYPWVLRENQWADLF